jgi:hypothetical protein
VNEQDSSILKRKYFVHATPTDRQDTGPKDSREIRRLLRIQRVWIPCGWFRGDVKTHAGEVLNEQQQEFASVPIHCPKVIE